MSRVSNVAPVGQTVRPLATTVRRLAFAGRSCAKCGSFDIRPSRTRNALDILLACVFLTPFRCRFCRGRFYRFWRSSLRSSDLPSPPVPVAPLLIMPSRRGIPTVDPASPQRIEPQPLPAARNQPRVIPPARKAGTVTSAFIERLESGMRSPRPLPDTPPGAVLILESDLSIRKLLRRLLERRGYSAVEIAHVGDLKTELANGLADLLVIDVSDREGSDRQTMDMAFLFALARTHPGLKILALSMDAPLHNEIPKRLLTLPKPFSLDRFVDCVDRLLERS